MVMSYDDDFSRANERLIGFPAMYTPKCSCRCDACFHSLACRVCEIIDNLPTGSICLVDSAGMVEHILPEQYFHDYSEGVLEIAKNAVEGELDSSTMVASYFSNREQVPVECFDRSNVTLLRGDVLRIYAELNGIEVTF